MGWQDTIAGALFGLAGNNDGLQMLAKKQAAEQEQGRLDALAKVGQDIMGNPNMPQNEIIGRAIQANPELAKPLIARHLGLDQGGDLGVMGNNALMLMRSDPSGKLTYPQALQQVMTKFGIGGYALSPDGSRIISPNGYADATALNARAKVSGEQQAKIDAAPFVAQAEPLPDSIVKSQSEMLDEIKQAQSIQSRALEWADKLAPDPKSGKSTTLTLGPVSNMLNSGRNWLGESNAESGEYGKFRTFLEDLRNKTLLLQKGTQTEGDAQRALAAIAATPNDGKLVAEQMRELARLNALAAESKLGILNTQRAEYGKNQIGADGNPRLKSRAAAQVPPPPTADQIQSAVQEMQGGKEISAVGAQDIYSTPPSGGTDMKAAIAAELARRAALKGGK